MKNSTITITTTPTKLILIGEHSVLRGKRGIVMPVFDFATTCTVTEPFDTLRERDEKRNDKYIVVPSSWTKILQSHTKQNISNTEFLLSSQAPIGSGMGVSASGSVAFVKAWYEYFELSLEKSTLYALAQQLESLNHGTASGIDAAAIIEEQALSFQRIDGEMKLKPLDIDTETHPLLTQITIHQTSQPQESTAEMVAWVTEQEDKQLEQYSQYWGKLDRLAEEMEKLILHTKSSSNESELIHFRKLINQAGHILESVGIVSAETQQLSKTFRAQGKGVKVSGAGGRAGGSGILIVV